MKIETDIPIPPAWSGTARYPFGQMKKGESIDRPKEFQNTLRTAASQYKGRHPGWDYKTRIQGNVMRLWCVAVPQTEGDSP